MSAAAGQTPNTVLQEPAEGLKPKPKSIKPKVAGPTGRKGKKTAGEQEERDIFDMSEDDEEYMPTTKEQKDSEAVLGKRGLGIIRTKRNAFNPKEVFAQMRADEDARAEARRLNRLKEQDLVEAERRACALEVLEEVNAVVVKANDGLVHFAGKLYKINEEGELVEAQGLQTQAQAFEQLNQLAQKYSLEQQKALANESGQGTIDESEYRQILSEKRQNLKVLVGLLGHRHRNVSALFKSRVDWKRYASTNHLEKQLEQNRKDGFIDKQLFLAETQNRQKKAHPT